MVTVDENQRDDRVGKADDLPYNIIDARALFDRHSQFSIDHAFGYEILQRMIDFECNGKGRFGCVDDRSFC